MSVLRELVIYTAHAQDAFENSGYTTTDSRTFADLIATVLDIINTLVPFIFAIALLVFLFKVFETFILHGDSEDGRERGRNVVIIGIISLAIMMAIWAIVSLISDSVFFGG